MSKTVFGDARAIPNDSYRVQTEASTYTVSLHEERGRKYALIRGEAGGDRENVVVRDSDPRVGEQSLFELHYTEWVGKPLDVASMRTSPIVAATRLVTVAAGAVPDTVSQRVVPPGMPENPRIVPMPVKGTAIGETRGAAAFAHTPAAKAAAAQADLAAKQARELARQVVAAADAPSQLPYPDRHVRYAEDIATLLRSIHRRDRLFDDVRDNRDLRERLINSLDAAEKLLAEIKARNR
ncbi:MAG: hypothetical protein ABI591_09430 [Kofleriaceae bacterium]